MPPGTYKLSIEASGFKKSERTGILLVANDKMTLGDIALEVGQASETVTITAETTQVQAESAERSSEASCPCGMRQSKRYLKPHNSDWVVVKT